MSASITVKSPSALTPHTPWYVYLIENRLGQLYTGITNDPQRRILQHRGELPGGAKALRGKSPLKYRFVYQVNDKSQALKMEIAIKKLNRTEKMKMISENNHSLFERFMGKPLEVNQF